MDVDPSFGRMRQQTPFGPTSSRNRFHVEELHQQEEDAEEANYEYQPVWDEDTEPFPWEPEEEPNFPVGASTPEETPPVNPPNRKLTEHIEFNHEPTKSEINRTY
ncbi:hypothetical protein QE152_g39016 [Popillia japonica]|uniref:Uncharacterized protein n=1 Tax=Popillia japonica TaxID=7064 RepID=A0AAW1HUW1_POPJA